MRRTLGLIGAALVTLAAGSAGAQSAAVTVTTPIPLQSNAMTPPAQNSVLTNTAMRVNRAKLAAARINRGDCAGALRLARTQGDRVMADHITRICAASPS